MPAVVPGVTTLLQAVPELPPPQANMPPARETKSSNMPNIARIFRRRGTMPKSNRQARTAPPRVYQGIPPGISFVAVQEFWLGVVVKVRVAVPGLALVMLTGLVEPKLKVGTCCAPDGLDPRTAVKVTLPVKPLAGVTVIVDALPVVAPAVTVIVVPETVNEGTGGGVTVTVPVPVALL